MINTTINKLVKIKPIAILISFALLTTIFRWGTSFHVYPEEGINLKNILDLNDIYYFPYILNLIELNFSPTYSENLISEKLLPIPIYSVVIHSIFYFFFKSFSFVIIEFLSLTFFFIILLKIFKELNFSNSFSIFLSVFTFTFIVFIPIILSTLDITFINLDVFSNLYSFRTPRPIITSLYFFFTILLLIKIFKGHNSNNLYLLLGIFLGLNLVSFYYNFVILSLITLFVISQTFFIQKEIISQFVKKNMKILISFLLTISPFLFLSYHAEPDLLERFGVLSLEWNQKKIILFHILSKLFEFQFLVIFILNTSLFYLLIKKNNQYCMRTISIFYLLFLSSVISPILFILLSPTVVEIHNFLNLIVIIGLIVFLIFSIIIFLNFTNFYKKIKSNNFYYLLISLALIIIYNLNYYSTFKEKKNNFLRKDITKLEKFYQENKSNLNNLMSFEPQLQVWWLFHGEKKLTSIDSTMVSLNHSQIEKNFLENLKYLKINQDTFKFILENKKQGWRYENKIVKYFSMYKYLANSLFTFKNSQNFKKVEHDFIKRTPPTRSQQIVLPKEEQLRLLNLYKEIDGTSLSVIDIIILKKDSIIGSNAIIDNNKFCKLNNTKIFNIYINSNKMKCY